MMTSFILKLLDWKYLPIYLQHVLILRIRKSITKSDTHKIETIYLDLSVIKNHDAGTGIQRVVRSISKELAKKNEKYFNLQEVYATKKTGYKIYQNFEGYLERDKELRIIDANIFFGLDHCLDSVTQHKKQLLDFKKKGAIIIFFMHDLLPLTHPQWFSSLTVIKYERWFRTIAMLADGFFCNSEQTERDLIKEMNQRYCTNQFWTKVVPMGFDIKSATHSVGIDEYKSAILKRLETQITALIVGTLEPRKGHMDIIKAFEVLWEQGVEINLLIVGRKGWHVEELEIYILNHKQYANKLIWLDDLTDDELELSYKISRGVIVASFAEGFGLPLVEALYYGKKVLARGIPIFYQHAKRGVNYFATDIQWFELAEHIKEWIFETENDISQRFDMPKWSDTALTILQELEQRYANLNTVNYNKK